jgi:trehalose-6-phosphatase
LDIKNNIKENLVGTNGVYYKHNYFLALIHDENIYIDDTNKEVGDIKIMDINTCLELIRPYHHNKIIILKKIHNLITNFMLEYTNLIEELSI